ncbi:hypothetical protein QJS04_geneDACA015440 [Acorus gramineus]|uniref:Uncharacterized protein n=1 Tax=Acorus gramineus TaxID=55184 RepID=A0AAV9A5K6_ACOGR|nr:hypothetical protein QJS04_geneDACA015440 [Acorus gramineus]
MAGSLHMKSCEQVVHMVAKSKPVFFLVLELKWKSVVWQVGKTDADGVETAALAYGVELLFG